MKKLINASILALMALCVSLSSCQSDDVASASISIEKSVVLYVDSTFQLTATTTPESAAAKVHWNSNDTAVVTVSNTGLLTAVAKGSAVVTANVGNAIAVCNVTVHNNPVTLQLKMQDIAQKKCTVTVKPSDEEGYYYCGYATSADIAKATDAQLMQTVMKNLNATIQQYAAYGYSYTLKNFLQQGTKNLIASGLTANTDYVMFAFGVDVESGEAGKVLTRLPFKTAEVVPSSMTFQIAFDSIAKVAKVSKGDTTYTYTCYFKCTPSNETETYVFNGVTAQILDSLYDNDVMKYLTEMEAYYDKNYSSYGGFEGTMVKAGARDVYAKNMVHGTKYIFFAAGYNGGFSTNATTYEYTFQHPDSAAAKMPARREPEVELADEVIMTDFKGVYFPGVCH